MQTPFLRRLVSVAPLFGFAATFAAVAYGQEFGGGDEPSPEGMAAMIMAIIIASGIAVAVGLAINAVICYLLWGCFKRIPQQYRLMEPGMVWLLMIPCVGLVWNFFVFPRLSQSFQQYFAAQGRTDVGDCGKTIGLAFAICVILSIVPIVQYCAGVVTLVLLIIYLVKVLGLKGQIPESAAG